MPKRKQCPGQAHGSLRKKINGMEKIGEDVPPELRKELQMLRPAACPAGNPLAAQTERDKLLAKYSFNYS